MVKEDSFFFKNIKLKFSQKEFCKNVLSNKIQFQNSLKLKIKNSLL